VAPGRGLKPQASSLKPQAPGPYETMSIYAALETEEADRGVVIRLKVHAGARREGVGGVHDGALKVEVHAAPERGKANKAVIAVLAAALGVPRGQIAILTGESSSLKRVAVCGLTADRLRMRLDSGGKGTA